MIVRTDISTNTPKGFLTYVYNQPSFLKHNNTFEQYHIYGESDGVICFHAAFSLKEEIAYGPYRSPFGGIEYASDLETPLLEEMIVAIEQELKSRGIREIRLHQPPANYQSDRLLNQILHNSGYEVLQERQFHGIEVNKEPLIERMHKMEQRKYNLCLRGGAEFRQLKKKEALEAFKWIERNRAIAQKPSSMTWVDLENASHRNPETYLVFGVFMDGYLLAATVVVKVNEQAIYHFLPATVVDFQDYRKYSPMVFLVNGLYQWCQHQGIKLLDLGTSYVEKRLKVSLVNFKEHIGGRSSIAYSWRKLL